MTTEAQLYPLTELTNTLSVFSSAPSMNSNTVFATSF